MAERVARSHAKLRRGREGRVVASSSSVGASGVDEKARAMEAPRRESPISRD